jgi:hypothetical protein
MDDARRRLLAGSIFAYCTLEQVAEQIAASAAQFDCIYVERLGSTYRWSPMHRGGPYPLLREVAKLLDLPYRLLVLPFGTADEWTIVRTEDLDTEPDAWASSSPPQSHRPTASTSSKSHVCDPCHT